MHTRQDESFPRMPAAASFAPGALTAIVVAAGFATVVAWFALLILEERHPAPTARAAAATCGVCGVVKRVREVEPAPRQQLEGSSAESAVILIAAMGGAAGPDARPARLYETSVLHDDGYVRVLRDTGAPQWKVGDRVKVIKGRVEPDASPAGRISTPGLQATRVR